MIVVLEAKWELNCLLSFCHQITSDVCPGCSYSLSDFFFLFILLQVLLFKRERGSVGGRGVFRHRCILGFGLPNILLTGAGYSFVASCL